MGKTSQEGKRLKKWDFYPLCNHAITQLRKIFENLREFWANERETGKTANNFMYLSQFDKVFLVSHVCDVIFNACQTCQTLHFDCAKEFAF